MGSRFKKIPTVSRRRANAAKRISVKRRFLILMKQENIMRAEREAELKAKENAFTQIRQQDEDYSDEDTSSELDDSEDCEFDKEKELDSDDDVSEQDEDCSDADTFSETDDSEDYESVEEFDSEDGGDDEVCPLADRLLAEQAERERKQQERIVRGESVEEFDSEDGGDEEVSPLADRLLAEEAERKRKQQERIVRGLNAVVRVMTNPDEVHSYPDLLTESFRNYSDVNRSDHHYAKYFPPTWTTEMINFITAPPWVPPKKVPTRWQKMLRVAQDYIAYYLFNEVTPGTIEQDEIRKYRDDEGYL